MCFDNFKGVKIRPQFPGRPTGMLFSLESTVHPFISHPSYAEIADKTLEEKVAAMKEEPFKQRILSEEPSIPKMFTAMFRIGEETGELGEMVDKLADFYEDEVTAAVKALTSVLEPMMIVIVQKL